MVTAPYFGPEGNAVAGRRPPSRLRLCAIDQRHFVVGADHIHYVVRNDFFSLANDRECILNKHLGPNFAVTKSLARSRTPAPAAFVRARIVRAPHRQGPASSGPRIVRAGR
jgi:hypothetical protein